MLQLLAVDMHYSVPLSFESSNFPRGSMLMLHSKVREIESTFPCEAIEMIFEFLPPWTIPADGHARP